MPEDQPLDEEIPFIQLPVTCWFHVGLAFRTYKADPNGKGSAIYIYVYIYVHSPVFVASGG